MKHIKLKDILKEGKVNEALARGLKPLLMIGSTITKNVGENALVKLSDKFDRIDDEYAGDIASHLDMAIELMQDGYPGDATKKLKQFNNACKDVLKGKSIKSAFAEGVVNEDRFGHPITALGNQIYIQLDKMEQKLSGKEKNNYMRARSAFWKITKAAMEDEEQK